MDERPREAIARAIIDLAKAGERDPEVLRTRFGGVILTSFGSRLRSVPSSSSKSKARGRRPLRYDAGGERRTGHLPLRPLAGLLKMKNPALADGEVIQDPDRVSEMFTDALRDDDGAGSR